MSRKRTHPPVSNQQAKAATNASAQQSVTHHQVEAFSGPLPHPTILAEYNRLHPDFAERIFAMAEKEQQHRH